MRPPPSPRFPDPGMTECCGQSPDAEHGFFHCWTRAAQVAYVAPLAFLLAAFIAFVIVAVTA